MTKTLKWLGGGIAAAMLLGLAGLFSGPELAEAQPSAVDARFAGTVTLDGEPAAAGTSVVAIVAGAECGSGTVVTGANGSTYQLNSPSSCAESGDEVHFRVGGVYAAETGTWNNTAINHVNLNATTPAPEEDMGDMDGDMDECPDEGMGDMDGDMNGDMGDEDMGDDPPEPGMGDDPPEPGMDGDDPPEPGMDDDMNGDMDGDMGDMDGDMADDCPEPDMDGDDPPEPDMGEDDTDMDDTDMDDTDMDDTDMDDTDMDDTDMDDTDMAPEVSDAGTGLSTSTSTSLVAILGVMALAVTLGGYTFARRRR